MYNIYIIHMCVLAKIDADLLLLFMYMGTKRFVAMGKRLMKMQHVMEELEKSIEDKHERSKVLEGLLGYIISSTQVYIIYIYHTMIHTHATIYIAIRACNSEFELMTINMNWRRRRLLFHRMLLLR